MNNMIDYSKILQHTANLPWYVLVTTGRAGSDLFQSLLDSHPEAFVFNGKLQFHDFWKKSHCKRAVSGPDPEDVADEFIGNFIYKFKSKYRVIEKKDRLGPNQDRCISVDTGAFRQHLVHFLTLRTLTTRNMLESIYIAYALCMNQDIFAKKIFFHHQHTISNLPDFLKDFPDSPVISMTRDPRALLVSGVENWAKFDPTTNHAAHYYAVLKRVIDDATAVHNMGVRYTVLKLEDLGNEAVLQKMCQWMGIHYHICMKESTWGGLKWWGDALSTARIVEDTKGFSTNMVTNRWEKKLQWSDKFLLNFLLKQRLERYGYPIFGHASILAYLITPFLILFPTTYEKRFLSFRYFLQMIHEKQYRNIGKSFYYYFKRVFFFYKLFYRKICRRIVISPLVSDASSC